MQDLEHSDWSLSDCRKPDPHRQLSGLGCGARNGNPSKPRSVQIPASAGCVKAQIETCFDAMPQTVHLRTHRYRRNSSTGSESPGRCGRCHGSVPAATVATDAGATIGAETKGLVLSLQQKRVAPPCWRISWKGVAHRRGNNHLWDCALYKLYQGTSRAVSNV